MKKNVILCLILLLCVKYANAQSGSLQVVHTAAIEHLLERHIEYNSTHQITGYRIRIFRDNNTTARQKAHEARNKFSGLFPDHKTYINYDNPYFKVTAGNFRSRDDALALFTNVKRYFPKAFIVMEHIRLPPLSKNDEEDEE